MLDLHPNYTTPAAWQAGLRPGNVVLFRFPYAEPDAAEPPKSRTCLVLEVERRSDGTYVELAYGTSADTSANRGEEIHVNRPEALAAAGLHRKTRFVGARRILVRLDDPGFDVNRRYGTPVLGRLDARDMERMDCVRARIKAFPDGTSERCCARQRRSASTAGLIVEKRGSRRALRDRIATAQGRTVVR